MATEWLARGHGHPPTSDDDARGGLSRGVRPARVADATAGCLTSPWSRTVSVPRWAGAARLGEVTPVNRLLDVSLSRLSGRIRAAARSAVDVRTNRCGGLGSACAALPPAFHGRRGRRRLHVEAAEPLRC